MSPDPATTRTAPLTALRARLDVLLKAFAESDLTGLLVEQEDWAIGIKRARRPVVAAATDETSTSDAPPARGPVDVVKADLVGVIHFSRPAPVEGLAVAGDRELAYVEALGIRNPVRSRGSGRIVEVNVTDGQSVDYGRPLFTIERLDRVS